MDMSLDSDDFDLIVGDINNDYLLALSLQKLEEEFNSDENRNRKSNAENDYELALSLSKIDELTHSDTALPKTTISAKDIVSPQLELTDPNPNIWHLMKDFDDLFFGGVLGKHCIELSWSSRMTRTAGLCGWNPKTNYCFIRLSLPLLQLRSRKDLVETLIHEMIHAVLFVTRTDDNHESHGSKFHEHMYRINRESGADITVYHDFMDEVNHYLKHIWRCNGKCQNSPPYFGYVKRSMNRKPGPNDYWFKYHESSCGGTFIKLSEPKKEEKVIIKEVVEPKMIKNKDIRSYFSPTKSEPKSSSSQIVSFSGSGLKLGSNETENELKTRDKRMKNVSNVNKIENFFTINSNNSLTLKESDKSVANINTLKTGFEKTIIIESNKKLEAFAGKGYVLGRPKSGNVRQSTDVSNVSNNRLLGETREQRQQREPKFLLTQKRPKSNIEVIQID